MLLLRAPTDDQARAYLARQGEQPFSYDGVGCTREPLTACRGWNIDRQRVLLGPGEDVFYRASAAIDAWRMFPPEMTRVVGGDVPARGLAVAVVYRAAVMPIWLVMPARVVYTMHEDDGSISRHGFAYGTLPGHPERGEERFLVQWNRETDEVHYDLLAVSQPSSWFARLGYWYARLEQARFRRLSGAAMQRAVSA
jgi:uncharacterized protein (UPF0548 family)